MKKNNRLFKWSQKVSLGGSVFDFDTAVISGVERFVQKLFQLNSFWNKFVIVLGLIGAMTAGKPKDTYG